MAHLPKPTNTPTAPISHQSTPSTLPNPSPRPWLLDHVIDRQCILTPQVAFVHKASIFVPPLLSSCQLCFAIFTCQTPQPCCSFVSGKGAVPCYCLSSYQYSVIV